MGEAEEDETAGLEGPEPISCWSDAEDKGSDEVDDGDEEDADNRRLVVNTNPVDTSTVAGFHRKRRWVPNGKRFIWI